MIGRQLIQNLLLVLALAVGRPSVACANDRTEAAGDILAYGLPAFAAGMTVWHEDSEGALEFGKSGLLTGALTQGIKLIVNERRPDGGEYSFPSGHASYAFFSAEFICVRYGWKAGLPAYAAALFVGYSRVESKDHYVHDVLGGAAIGIGSSWIFTTRGKNWNIEAKLGDGCFGLSLCRRW